MKDMHIIPNKNLINNCAIPFQIVLIFSAFSELLLGDAYYTPYLIILISAYICLLLNFKCAVPVLKHLKILSLLFALFFSLMVTLANYNIWSDKGISSFVLLGLLLLGSISAFYQILIWCAVNAKKLCWQKCFDRLSPMKTFALSFFCIATIDLIVLFLCKYPGILTTDSVWQIDQILSNHYSNHHPFWDTMTIRFFIYEGLHLFHDINAAIACYSVFSIIFMATSFSFALATIAELNAPKWVTTLLLIFFSLMPYHIMYSFTMWKDVLFGGFTLSLVVFLFRINSNMSLKKFNYLGFIITGMGVSLFRSNGLFVFVLTALFFFIFYRMKNKRLVLLFVLIIFSSFILKHPVLKAMDVTQPDTIESLSIPVQQIVRDYIEHDDYTDDQRELLGKVIDLNQIKNNYNPQTSDPIKKLVREKDNQEYINENGGKFISLYLSRLRKHPLSFVRAWIDQTKGYWNAGYPYWRWADWVTSNDFGAEQRINNKWLNAKINSYLMKYEQWPMLWIFLSIGFFDWLALWAFFISICRQDKAGIMTSIPIIFVVISLMIATPVFSEFRYAYASFCTLPIILTLVLRPNIIIQRKDKSCG